MKPANPQPGKVYITGAGPGDSQLLTLRAKAVIELADTILFDNLVNQDILDWAKPGVEKIFVGKLPYCSVITQETINQWMVDKALEGKQVVRLKGGDPMIFGRGAEEAAFLKENGIEFEIVPGVTSALAAGAYSGIPMTHRDGTIVFYMGVKNIGEIASHLVNAGKSVETLVAVVENGSLPQQKVVTGNLTTISQEVEAANIGTPALIIVGEVVKYHQEINWFNSIQEQYQQRIA
ncbi:MAG: uroporphyrinogen-III C-methyltransferase [Flavihumibacter sp.]|nr:uroporphyrinogen-III C-methyltransferase [Flavihumibacter sp.]